MSAPVGPHLCDACQLRIADSPDAYCLSCKRDWRRGIPAAGRCVECHEGMVAAGDILCWWCAAELLMCVSGEDAPPCND